MLIAASFWVYVLFLDGLSGNSKKFEDEIAQYKQDLILSKQTIAKKDGEIAEIEEDIEGCRSKLEFFEESIRQTEDQVDAGAKDREELNNHIGRLRDELSNMENRLLEEKIRGDTLENMNTNMALSLDNSIQEVRRLQTIIRTLSNN